MDDLTSAILAIIVIVLPVVAAILGLVFGIIITGSKTTRIRPLGISFIFTSVYALISGVAKYAGGVFGGQYAAISVVLTFLEVILTTLSLFFLCRFLHKSYGSINIYIPLIALQLAGIIIPRVLIVLIDKVSGLKYDEATSAIRLCYSIGLLITGTAVAVIVIMTLMKNRNIEKVIPSYWIFRIIMLILFLINVGIEMFCYVLPANDALIFAENIKIYAVVAESIVTAISMGYVMRRSLRTAWE